MDKVIVEDLKFRTIIGLWDWERQMPQMVSVDLEMACEMDKAAASGKLEDTLDYKAISKRVEQFVQEKEFELVESAATGVAELVMHEFDVPWIRVTLRKPFAVTHSKAVGVVVERSRDGA